MPVAEAPPITFEVPLISIPSSPEPVPTSNTVPAPAEPILPPVVIWIPAPVDPPPVPFTRTLPLPNDSIIPLFSLTPCVVVPVEVPVIPVTDKCALVA